MICPVIAIWNVCRLSSQYYCTLSVLLLYQRCKQRRCYCSISQVNYRRYSSQNKPPVWTIHFLKSIPSHSILSHTDVYRLGVSLCYRVTSSITGKSVRQLESVKPRSHCADHSLPMSPIIADRPDLSWSWQNHQIVALAPDLCLSKTASAILVPQLYDTGTTEVFDPLLVRFPRPLVRPLIRSTRLRAWCWRPHPRSCRLATTIKTT